MHNSKRYTNIILLLIITMMILKIGRSYVAKGINYRKQLYRYPLSLINDKIYSNRLYHSSSSCLMMSTTDSGIDDLNNNIQIAG